MNDLVRSLPIRDIDVRCGTQTNCAGVAVALVDFERGSESGFEVVDAVTELSTRDAGDQDLVDFCAEHIGEGIKAELQESFGAGLPAVRVLVRRVGDELGSAAPLPNCRARPTSHPRSPQR
jgi:hypothetical protein